MQKLARRLIIISSNEHSCGVAQQTQRQHRQRDLCWQCLQRGSYGSRVLACRDTKLQLEVIIDPLELCALSPSSPRCCDCCLLQSGGGLTPVWMAWERLVFKSLSFSKRSGVRTVNQSVSQSLTQPVSQSVTHSPNQSVGHSVHGQPSSSRPQRIQGVSSLAAGAAGAGAPPMVASILSTFALRSVRRP